MDSNADGDALKLTAAIVEGRVQITATWYDSLDRAEDRVRFGTYGANDFDRDGMTVPARSDSALRSTTTQKVRKRYGAKGTKVRSPRNFHHHG